MTEVAQPVNTWLSWTLKDNQNYAANLGLYDAKAFEFKVPRFGDSPNALSYSPSFGFWMN